MLIWPKSFSSVVEMFITSINFITKCTSCYLGYGPLYKHVYLKVQVWLILQNYKNEILLMEAPLIIQVLVWKLEGYLIGRFTKVLMGFNARYISNLFLNMSFLCYICQCIKIDLHLLCTIFHTSFQENTFSPMLFAKRNFSILLWVKRFGTTELSTTYLGRNGKLRQAHKMWAQEGEFADEP